ncbi:endonuclease/exonuclease/phosphatase family protein [Thermomonospora umbrina]|uniref:endonuclease/exonuclease/phosphatase family protein n=1 Tax=Thermomonospora umbrina TaxID=111806 RepID=UPI0011C12453|nr:endonuclease/exonuclease/phosphatase family protein [Thermomonospora umbrina]
MSETFTGEEADARSSPRPERWRSAVAWTVAGCWGVWAAARLVAVDRLPGLGMPAIPLISFTPYVAATAAVPVACAAILRHRWALLASALVAAALVAPMLPRAMAGGQPAAQGPTVRVLTANLLFGQARPERVLQLVRRHDVDVLSLQELTPQAVAGLEAAGLTRLLPYKVIDPRTGAAGTGLYARHPLRALPAPPGTVMAMPRAEFSLPGGRTVEVTAVHPPPPISRAAVRHWRHDLRALPSSSGGRDGRVRILAGDYNATLDHAHLRRVLSRGYADAADRTGGGLIPTWGVSAGARTPLTIDHILVDRRCAVRDLKVYDIAGSDHRAVFADVRLP